MLYVNEHFSHIACITGGSRLEVRRSAQVRRTRPCWPQCRQVLRDPSLDPPLSSLVVVFFALVERVVQPSIIHDIFLAYILYT